MIVPEPNRRNNTMRTAPAFALAAPLLLVGACNFQNDAANDEVRIEYNQQRIEDAAQKAGNAARDVASAAGNVAASTGAAIGNEVGDIDVDVNVSRNQSGGNSAH
jgi:hypothetical protein